MTNSSWAWLDPMEAGPKVAPIAYIEDEDKCVPLFNFLIPNDLDDEGLARYVSAKICSLRTTRQTRSGFGG